MQLIKTVCDICYGRSEETLSTGVHTVTLDKQMIEVDCCDEHWKGVQALLQPVFDQGRRPEGSTRRRRTSTEMASSRSTAPRAQVVPIDGQFQCPVEDCERHARPYASRTGLRDHVRIVHNTTLRVLEGDTPSDALCDVPGCGTVAKSLAGLLSHNRSAHPEKARA